MLSRRWTHALRVAAVVPLLALNGVACATAMHIRVSSVVPTVRDTLFILSTDSYTVAAYRRDDMIPTTALAASARVYERLFGERPPNILVFTSNEGWTPALDLPSARDTVFLAADPNMPSTVQARERSRAAAFLVARAWVSSAVERAAERTESDSVILIPTWFDAAAAMLVTFHGSEWSERLERAQRLTGVVSIEALLGNGDRSVLPAEEGTAMNVQSAALLEYFWERDPDALIGLPTRLGRGTSIYAALLGRGITDLTSINASWADWYSDVQGGRK